MRTKLDDYCQQFARHLEPLPAPLERACVALEQATQGTPARDLLTPLATLRHDLRALVDKVKSQQAYMLIFGPLKSGKSTLMNAVAGAYVSEVSSLPAYPCLVFVGAGTRREYEVTRYDGATASFSEPAALAKTIADAHVALADAIRTAEQQNLAFDPQDHLPSAIRRIDVRLPGSDLQSRSAVLVDTPGLYTRMRFGYDRMTRDFRDAAACAIFVVKSDTLFLEQVFAEFEDLLDLWSRIFLVVNVDSGKRDVAPDGKLVPSLEQSEPDAILQAFRRLAMPAPLHRAAAEGRVRMFPVDLLRAASAVLQNEAPPPDFARFSADLSAFLGSDEYLAAFRRDSLRRGDQLTLELVRALGGPGLQKLAARIDELQQQLEFTQAEIDLLRRAAERDYTAAFTRSERAVADELERTARDEGQKLLRTLGASIDTWFLSGHSLQWLIHDHWRPLLADYHQEVASAGHKALEQGIAQGASSLDLPAAVVDLCDRRDLDLRALRRAALAGLGAPAPRADIEVPVDVDAIPFQRGLLDFLAFRSLDAVRRRLFGPKDRPDHKIPGKEKAARLGEPGRLHLHQCVTQLRAVLVPAVVAALQQHFGERLRAATLAELQARLRAELPPLEQAEARLQRELDRLRALHGPLADLRTTADELRARLPALARTFGQELGAATADGREAIPGERTVVLDPAPRPVRSGTTADRR